MPAPPGGVMSGACEPEGWRQGDPVHLPADLPWEAVFSKRLDRERCEILIAALGGSSLPPSIDSAARDGQ